MMDTLIDFLLAFAFIFIGYYVTRALEKHHLPKIDTARQKAISGKWSGVYRQEANENRESCELTIDLELNAGPRKIIGTMRVSEDMEYEFNIEGAFYHNKYLRLHYTAAGKTEAALDFGSMFLVLGDLPNKMRGKVVGYGSISETLVSGILMIEKHK